MGLVLNYFISRIFEGWPVFNVCFPWAVILCTQQLNPIYDSESGLLAAFVGNNPKKLSLLIYVYAIEWYLPPELRREHGARLNKNGPITLVIFSLIIQILRKMNFFLFQVIRTLSLQNFAYVTTAVLSWHRQNCVAILLPGINSLIIHEIWDKSQERLVKRSHGDLSPCLRSLCPKDNSTVLCCSNIP